MAKEEIKGMVNENFAYIYDVENNSYTYIITNDIQSDTLTTSYNSYLIDLATINFDLSYINDIYSIYLKDNSKGIALLDKNLLVVSMLDDKMYYDRNSNKTSYQYNSVLFINNEKNIVPLSLNIKDINSALTIDNNEIQVKIDNDTIINDEQKLSADYTKLRLANNESAGIFMVDNESLMMENNKVTLSYTISDVIDSIDEHITVMNNVINQCSDNLDQIIINFKEYPLYDKKYSCNINQNYDLYYYDENKYNVLMGSKNDETNHYHYIDYRQKYFKIKIKIVYNYLSGNISDYNPFDANNLSITIQDTTIYPNAEDNQNNFSKKIIVSDFIKYNFEKSYIFNEGIIKYDEITNNIFGEVNYICYFNILDDELYDMINLKNKFDIPNCLSFKINFKYHDKKIGIDSTTYANLDLLIDKYNNDLKLHQMIYHDYSVGFNYDKIGNQVGICMIPNSEKYQYDANIDENIVNKPIFLKYFNNENNYIINRISDDNLKPIMHIRTNNLYPNGSGDVEKPLNKPVLIGEENIDGQIIFYKNYNIDIINENILSLSNSIEFYDTEGENINKFFRTKTIYKSDLETTFNDTYNIYGNGLRKGDCYVPCLSELALFYLYGFYPYINYIEDESYEIVNGNKLVELDSSTLYYDAQNDKLYLYSIDFSNINNVKISPKRLIGTLKINEYGKYVSTTGKTLHRSISLFKIPDYSVLLGNYYLSFDEEENCEIINYSTKKSISINIKSYNKYRPINLMDFFIQAEDKTINISSITVKSLENDIHRLSFNINGYTNLHNEINIYYKDSDESLNNIENIILENTGSGSNYRKLCKLSIKIE